MNCGTIGDTGKTGGTDTVFDSLDSTNLPLRLHRGPMQSHSRNTLLTKIDAQKRPGIWRHATHRGLTNTTVLGPPTHNTMRSSDLGSFCPLTDGPCQCTSERCSHRGSQRASPYPSSTCFPEHKPTNLNVIEGRPMRRVPSVKH